MPRHKRSSTAGCAVDMTPMIDVVFQLIIFFIVTIKMEEDKKDIILAKAKDGPVIERMEPTTMVVEVDKKGWISMHGAQLSKAKFTKIMQGRTRRYGQFPVLIRADKRAQHKDVRAVMDICSQLNIWRINFAAIKQEAN